MAKKCWIEKLKRKPKFAIRRKNRCSVCGRARSYLRKFGICRICFRSMAHQGVLPGVTKSSW
jgi:small subunit ribosomal protein S14